MFHTVEDVLRLEGFEGVRLVAGRRGLGRTVTSASLMEVPDILPYVEENTLLITTLYPIAGSREQMEQLIPELGSRGVAGICIKPLRYIEQIPPVMISQADELGFPIVELPMGANLSTLVNLVLSMSLNDYISQLQFRDSVHRNMMEMLLSGAEVEELAEKLAELLQKDIVLLDNQLDSICAALLHDVSKGTPGHALAGAGLMSQLGYPELAPLIAQHNDLEEPSRTDEAAVVFLADKLRRGAAPVRVTERFRESLSRCRDEEARRAHGRRLEAALESARRINDICGKDVVQI